MIICFLTSGLDVEEFLRDTATVVAGYYVHVSGQKFARMFRRLLTYQGRSLPVACFPVIR